VDQSRFLLSERVRSRGRSSFVWRYGVGGFMVAALVSALAIQADNYGLSWAELTTPRFLARLTLQILVVGLLSGYLFGRTLWAIGERNRARGHDDS